MCVCDIQQIISISNRKLAGDKLEFNMNITVGTVFQLNYLNRAYLPFRDWQESQDTSRIAVSASRFNQLKDFALERLRLQRLCYLVICPAAHKS